MGSVASTNAGLSDLLQTLSNENSPLLSTLSSPTVEAALQKAPAGDIAQISEEAIQLQVADSLFGSTSTPSFNATDALFGLPSTQSQTTDPLLAVLTSAYTGTPTKSHAATSSLFDVFA
jgi:hypothetical protein